MKKLLVLAMSLLMIFALAGCGSDEGGEEEKKTSFAIRLMTYSIPKETIGALRMREKNLSSSA